MMRRACAGLLLNLVIPARAGIQSAHYAQEVRWMPACAGMTLTGAFGQQAWAQAAFLAAPQPLSDGRAALPGRCQPPPTRWQTPPNGFHRPTARWC